MLGGVPGDWDVNRVTSDLAHVQIAMQLDEVIDAGLELGKRLVRRAIALAAVIKRLPIAVLGEQVAHCVRLGLRGGFGPPLSLNGRPRSHANAARRTPAVVPVQRPRRELV